MSILGAESYAAVHPLVTDVEVLSREERNHVLWYACDRGDLSMVKSVIRAGCDVDHFHRGHTPLMMASIGGHDDVVKELILAGCKVDLQSSKCFFAWFTLITKMASAWPVLVGWAMVILFMKVVPMMFVNILGYWLLVITITLHFLSEDSFKVSWVLRMKTRTKCIAWAGIVLPAVLAVWRMVGTAMSMSQLLLQATVLMALVTMTLLATVTAVTGIGGRTHMKEAKVTGAVTTATVVAVAVLGIGACGGVCVGVAAGALVAVTGFIVADTAAGAVAAAVEVAVTVTVTVAAIETVIAIWTAILAHTTLGTSAVANALAVIRTLVLVFSVTVADTRELLFSIIMILILAVIMMVITVLDTVLIPVAWPMASMLPVFVLLALTPIGALRRMSTTSITGMTALHYAAWYDHITCGTHLVEAGANVLLGNKYFRTPLHICSHRFRATVQRVQSHPPKQVIAVIGNTKYGKSTLIAALQSESRTFFQSLVYKLAQVYDITQRTTGIETVPFSSARYGDILFYDFAGQFEYHGPHQPFLEAMLHKPGVFVTMLLLVKVTEERAAITQQLIRWLQPVALTSTPSTPHVIVVGSFLDQVKSEKEAHQKLQGCIDSVQKEFPLLKVQELFLLDCREPESAGIKRLRHYLELTQPRQSASSALMYNVHWVMTQLQKKFSEQSIQLSKFREWLQENAQILPSHLPSPENMCQDLSAAGYILFLRNKQDPSQSWLVLDLETILHEVYGTLFSPSQAEVNQFGLLHCNQLSELFPKLDPRMIQEVLITLEFCIRVDPLLLKEEILKITELDEAEGWLYFPALATDKVCEVFEQDPRLHWACWQLKTDDTHIILAHLLQGILLHLAATHVFIEKELPRSVRMHCCSVWVNGLSWGSTTGVDVAVQISDSRTVQVIGQSRKEPAKLYRYMSSVTQSIFKTIAKLSPALKATPYIIHPYTYVGLDESRSAPPTTRYPVASIIRSIELGDEDVFSQPISSGKGSTKYSRAHLKQLFQGWYPTLTMVQRLKEAQKDPRECAL